MPLLIFGADIPIDQDFKLRYFLDENIVDQKSWEEFMPIGVSRELFEKFIKYYDNSRLQEYWKLGKAVLKATVWQAHE